MSQNFLNHGGHRGHGGVILKKRCSGPCVYSVLRGFKKEAGLTTGMKSPAIIILFKRVIPTISKIYLDNENEIGIEKNP